LVTPIRIVCANTQTAAIEAASASWGIRHTGGARAAIQEARTTLKLSWRYMQAFEEEAAQLYSQAMDIDQMLSARRPRKRRVFADRSVVNAFATLVVRRWLRSGSALNPSAQPSPPDRGAARR
jgi:predicted ATPase